MTTSVTITGSGTPLLAPGRAGPGAFVRHDDTVVQVDAGRATALRIAEAGLMLTDLDALLVTHHHSDHLLGVTDLALTRWIQHGARPYDPFPIHCPAGAAVDYLEHLFDHLGPDIESRHAVSYYPNDPHPKIVAFDAPPSGTVRIAEIGEIVIDATTVDHGDVAPAVAYRFTTPDGAIVISGDTRACDALEHFARGCDILVHEVFSGTLLAQRGAPPERIENLAHHHTEAASLGQMAGRIEAPVLIATHMIPPPVDAAEAEFFADGIRAGGFGGELTIADDLHTAAI